MCRSRSIKYGCGHVTIFRLSTCQGSYTFPSKHNTNKAACSSDPSLTFQSVQFCCLCSRDEAESQLTEEFEKMSLRLRMRAGRASQGQLSPDAVVEDPVAKAEEEFRQRLWEVGNRFPDGTRKKMIRPEKGRGLTRALQGSLLKVEVRPEEVVEKWTPGWSMDSGDDWGAWPQKTEDNHETEDSKAEEQRDNDAKESIEHYIAAFNEAEDEPSEDPDSDESAEEEDQQSRKPAAKPILTEKTKPTVLPPHLKTRMSASIKAKEGQSIWQVVELTVR